MTQTLSAFSLGNDGGGGGDGSGDDDDNGNTMWLLGFHSGYSKLPPLIMKDFS